MTKEAKPAITIYLAGPVDDVSEEEATGWQDHLAGLWPEVLFFSPSRSFLNGRAEGAAIPISVIERLVIRHCSGILAKLDGPGRGFGTIREVEFARSGPGNYRPCVCVGEFNSLMAWDVETAPDVEEGMTKLMEIIADVMNQPVHPLMGFMMGPHREEEGEED